jgi:hypothetical protein
MPAVGTGMYTTEGIDLIHPLDIPLGTRVCVLVVSHPDYGDPETDGTYPRPTLTDDQRRFWQSVLDEHEAETSSARRAGTT